MTVIHGVIVLMSKNQTMNNNPFSVERASPTGDKLVGGYVPQQTADYIALLALSQGCSISKLLRSILFLWAKDKLPKEKIIESLINKANRSWIEKLNKSRGKTGWKTNKEINLKFIEYKKELRKILRKRKIDLETIDRIIYGIKMNYENFR